jgi:hypothetical protein
MPRQNRVTPFGEIIAAQERGTVMGNRGVLHDASGCIRRAWQVRRWIVCALEFRGRKRTVMTPNRYTELFFLDEATALAAGHRPCAECQHARFIAFCNAWRTANPSSLGAQRATAAEIDRHLHEQRVGPERSKRSFIEDVSRLPDGVFVTMPGNSDQPRLVWGDSLLLWSPGGYRGRGPRPKRERVSVLTPRSTVEVIRAGYVPDVHPSAGVNMPLRPAE